MPPADTPQRSPWDDKFARTFIDYGQYFVPERETQIQIICDLIPRASQEDEAAPFDILELCCGEGLLAAALLERFPAARLSALDGSHEMLARACTNLAAYGNRFRASFFDMASAEWRTESLPRFRAVVSSLAVHHLDGVQKRELFRAVHRLLEEGGALILADLIEPATEEGRAVAARAWDEAVRRRSFDIGGDARAFEYFERERWNMYAHPETDPDPVDKPSRLFDQLKWLEEAGFSDVDVYWMLAGHAIFGGRKV